MIALVSITHSYVAIQPRTTIVKYAVAESFQSTLVRRKAPGKKSKSVGKWINASFYYNRLLTLKKPLTGMDSVVDQISAGVSLRESDFANLNLENNSLISFSYK